MDYVSAEKNPDILVDQFGRAGVVMQCGSDSGPGV
jgi:hypothetical protein